MRAPLIGIAIASLSALPTLAADLPSRIAPPVPFVQPVPIFTWTGFYIGVNAGVGFGNGRDTVTPQGFRPAPTRNGSDKNDRVGFTGGGQVGYNYQFGGGFVIGLEADGNFIDRGRKNNNVNGGGRRGSSFTVNRGKTDDFFGTVRGRLGYAFGRFLVYGTGGAAFGAGNGDDVVTLSRPPATQGGRRRTTTFSDRNNKNNNDVGFSVGGGVEYAITNNISVKGEYLFNSIGDRNRTLVATTAKGKSFLVKDKNEFSVARIGLNYRIRSELAQLLSATTWL